MSATSHFFFSSKNQSSAPRSTKLLLKIKSRRKGLELTFLANILGVSRKKKNPNKQQPAIRVIILPTDSEGADGAQPRLRRAAPPTRPGGTGQPPAEAGRRRYRLTGSAPQPKPTKPVALRRGAGSKAGRAAETIPPPGPTCPPPLSSAAAGRAGSPLRAGRRWDKAEAASATTPTPHGRSRRSPSCQGAPWPLPSPISARRSSSPPLFSSSGAREAAAGGGTPGGLWGCSPAPPQCRPRPLLANYNSHRPPRHLPPPPRPGGARGRGRGRGGRATRWDPAGGGDGVLKYTPQQRQ